MIIMMRLSLFVILAAMLLSGCQPSGSVSVTDATLPSAMTPTHAPASTLTDVPTAFPTLSPEAEQVVKLMLTSHDHWNTLEGVVLHTTFDEQGVLSAQWRVHIWVEQPFLGRVEGEMLQRNPDDTRTDDLWTQVITPMTHNSVGRSVDEAIQNLPHNFDEIELHSPTGAAVVYFHPLAGQLQTSAAELIFPTSLAQGVRGITPRYLTLLGEDEIAGRLVWVGDWQIATLNERGWTFWIDQETGMILKYVLWRNFEQIYEEIVFESITLDASFDPSLFEPVSTP